MLLYTITPLNVSLIIYNDLLLLVLLLQSVQVPHPSLPPPTPAQPSRTFITRNLALSTTTELPAMQAKDFDAACPLSVTRDLKIYDGDFKFGNFTSSLCRVPHESVLKSVQHDYLCSLIANDNIVLRRCCCHCRRKILRSLLFF